MFVAVHGYFISEGISGIFCISCSPIPPVLILQDARCWFGDSLFGVWPAQPITSDNGPVMARAAGLSGTLLG